MTDEITVDVKELTKLSVVCPNADCKAEVCFDLTKNLFAREMRCPACQNVLLEVRQQADGFAFTWASLIKKALRTDGQPSMFFRLKRE